jgi:hypothetical protein
MAVFLIPSFAAAQSEWLTWGYDQQRTGWNQAETVLTKDNVPQLQLKREAQLSTPPREEVLSTLTGSTGCYGERTAGAGYSGVRSRKRQYRLRHRRGDWKSNLGEAIPEHVDRAYKS